MRLPFLGCGALALGVALSYSQLVSADEAPAAPAAAATGSDDSNGLGEVVVVARRVEEKAQNVPISVTAISGETLKAASITENTDLIRLVPNLNVQHAATGPGVQFSLRGIRTGVVAYLNEVQLTTAGGSAIGDTQAVNDQIWDLASIQALSGPQGTLFGKNSTGGAILFVPQRPTDRLEGSIELGGGNYAEREGTGILNVPITDILKVRFGVHYIHHDPMVNNLDGPGMDSQDRWAGRASILFEPNSVINNYTVMDITVRHETAPPLIAGVVNSTAGCFQGLGCLYGAAPNNLAVNLGAQQQLYGVRTISSAFPSFDRAKDYGVSNILTINATDALSLRYIFGLRRSSYEQFSNLTSLNIPEEVGDNIDPFNRTIVNELQLIGKAFDNKLSFTTGLYASNQKSSGGVSYELFGQVGVPFNPANNTNNVATVWSNSRAVYGQATYALTHKLNFTAGLRYSQDKPSELAFNQQPLFTFFGPPSCGLPEGAPGVNFANCTRGLAAKFHATTYNLSFDYHVTDKTLVYITNRRGYNGGGFNASIPEGSVPGGPTTTYGPEYITDLELGVKSDWSIAGLPVRTNASIFGANYKDIQRTSFGITDTGAPFQGTANGPKARIYGFQLESIVRLFTGFFVNLNYGYLHTTYTEGTPYFPEGNQFAQAPKQTLNAGVSYTYPLNIGGELAFNTGLTYQSRETFQDSNTALAFQGGFTLIDARLTWNDVANSHVDVSVYGKNLTNKVYALEREDQTNFLGFVGSLYNDPRTYGVQATYSFGK
jgi:iron complex outermembrane receptor protein